MGFFDSFFRKNRALREVNRYFRMLDGYSPVWTTYEGGVYEMELTRSCIHAFATHASKLRPQVKGADLQRLQAVLDTRPNPFMLSSQFVYKCASILETCNTCYIVPLLDGYDRIVGYYPVMPVSTEVVDVGGVPYMRYRFRGGQVAAVELSRVGILVRFYLKHDLRGESNTALQPTMQLISTQNQGIQEGIKNAASYRFMAHYRNFAKEEDLTAERKKFTKANLAGGEDNGGLLLFPNTFSDVQQLKTELKIVDPEQMNIIETRVFDYFGCNPDVLQNKVNGDAWSAYYEGKVEPFAIQLSQAMTAMTYTEAQRARGNEIMWSSNRLQYMTNADKLAVAQSMFDRAVFCRNDVMDIWNLPHVPDGDKYYIRKEYAEVSKLGSDDDDDTGDGDPVEPVKVSELDTPKDGEGGSENE